LSQSAYGSEQQLSFIKKANIMTEKQDMIKEFFDKVGFRERIVIGMYDEARVYFHIDFSDELANGLVSVALLDENVYYGIEELISNLEAILEGVRGYKPAKNEEIH